MLSLRLPADVRKGEHAGGGQKSSHDYEMYMKRDMT